MRAARDCAQQLLLPTSAGICGGTGPGGAIIGGVAGLGGGDLGQGVRDVGGWLVNTLSDADCLVVGCVPQPGHFGRGLRIKRRVRL